MTQIQNVLLPVDFSQPSKKAFRYALALAVQFRARLVIAHVVPSLTAFDYGTRERTQELESMAIASAKKSLQEIIPADYRDRVHFTPLTVVGDVREELLRIIHDEKIDFVVMGTHGRRNIERFFLGSTTEHMLRKVSVPVLTVSRISPDHEALTTGPMPIRRIVYAADLSEGVETGLRYAAELARNFCAELILLHVIDPLEAGQWGIDAPGSLPFDLSAIQAMACERLQQAIQKTGCSNIRTSVFVDEGIPHNTIIRFADDMKADLLILSLRHKSLLERVMLGKTAERVIRASHIPVLSIPLSTGLGFIETAIAATMEAHR